MHFYGWTWEYTMGLRLKLFWTLVKQKNRIEARDTLRAINLASVPNLEEGPRKEYIADQEKTLGTIAVLDERDNEGIEKLKNLM